MDQWKSEGFCCQPTQPVPAFHQPPGAPPVAAARVQNSAPESSPKLEGEVKDSICARKVQKADREKLRRDRLNEQFQELGHALDPDRPKNDKATILADTIQLLKDLTAQVNRLKSEYSSLSEESNELTQEKNELREEKAALKSDIDNLNIQYQQRVRVMFPWSVDPSVVMAPSPYPYPMAVPVAPGPIPMHPSLQAFPFFPTQNHGAYPNPISTFLPYSSAPGNPQIELVSGQYVSSHPQTSSRSHTASKQDSKSKSSDRQRGSDDEKVDDANDVVTDLELKTPGSSHPSHLEVAQDREVSSEKRKGKRWSQKGKESGVTEGSCSSKCSSSHVHQESSSASVADGSITKN